VDETIEKPVGIKQLGTLLQFSTSFVVSLDIRKAFSAYEDDCFKMQISQTTVRKIE